MNDVSYLLIVDDSISNLNIIGNVLKNCNYKITVALNGKQALDILDQMAIDLILLDIMMPGMDGYEVCRKIKENPVTRDIPVIFMSALTDTKDIVEGFRSGGIDYITKPFKTEEIKVRVETHLKIRKQNRELKKLNDDKDLFISILAHDIKNPVNQLTGFSEIVLNNLRSYSVEEIENKMNAIHSFSKNLYVLLEDTLLWARSQSGKIEFSPEKLVFSELLLSVINYNKMSADSKKLTIKYAVHESDIVFADKYMLKVVLTNLLVNAIKFSRTGGTISIISEQTNSEIIITVSDTGIGIKPNDSKKLFDITKVYSTRGTAGEKGTGLGLILCWDFIKRHGGEISVESEVESGSTFKFSLPLSL